MTTTKEARREAYVSLHSELAKHLSGLETRTASGDPTARAELAGLRDGGRRQIGDHAQSWATVVRLVPEPLAGHNGATTRWERSVFHAVTLHALHVQGGRPGHDPSVSPGAAFRRLCAVESDSTRTRVYSALGAGSAHELVRHLTSLVTMLRRRGIPMDYLAIQEGIAGWDDPAQRTRTRLAWGRALSATKAETEATTTDITTDNTPEEK